MSETTSQIKLDGIGDAVKSTISRQARQTAEGQKLGIYVSKPKVKPKRKRAKKEKVKELTGQAKWNQHKLDHWGFVRDDDGQVKPS